MAQVNAGRVRFVAKGEYNNATQYYSFDLVNYNGNSYYAKENTIGNLPTDTTKWQLIAEKGNVGPMGPAGATGNGISSVRKTSTSGLVDTYTITFTNGTTTTFDITNGEDGEVTQEQLDKVQAELDYYKMLENALPKVEGEGESITLDGTAKCPMKLGFKGQIQQDSTTGKNKLPFDLETIKSYNTNGTWNNNVYSWRGLSATINDDGTFKVSSGTTTEAFTFYLYRDETGKRLSLEAGTYTFSSSSCPATGNGNLVFKIYNSEGQAIGGVSNVYLSGSTSSATRTINENCQVAIYLQVSNGATETQKDYAIQIESGSSATNWEQYTGNAPSPSPSYPQDIHIVSGDNEIKVEGKNLWGGFTFYRETVGLKFTQNLDGTVLADGTSTASGSSVSISLALSNGIYKTLPAGTYAISGGKSANKNVEAYDSGSRMLARDTGSGATFTLTEETIVILRATINSNQTANNEVFYLQLEKGSTATDYVKHQEYTKEINLPVENLWNLASSYSNTTSSNLWVLSDTTIAIPKGTYTLSCNNTNTDSNSIRFNYKYADNVEHFVRFGNKTTITFDEDVVKVAIQLYANTTISNIQIEQGTKANSYTPYGTTPIEMGGIGEYEDEFFKNTIDSEYYDSTLELDKWYLKKKIGKAIYKGGEDETWNIANTGTSNWYYRTLLPSQPIQNQGLSNYYLKATISNSNTEQGFMCINSDRNLRIRYGTEDTITNYKAWLSTHNLIVYYILATPTNTLLNDTLQETLDSFYSWQEQTNISQENNDLPFVIKASAIYDLNDLITRVATLETE